MFRPNSYELIATLGPRFIKDNMTHKEQLFDHALIQTRQARVADNAEDNFIIKAMVDDLKTRLDFVQRQFTRTLILCAKIDIAKQALSGWDKLGKVQFQDLLDTHFDDEMFDTEPNTLDLIVHLGALQIANKPEQVLTRMRQWLKPDGLMLAGFVGGDSLIELRQSFLAAEVEISGAASLRVAPFISVQDAGKLLQFAGFALPVVDVDSLTIRHDNLIALIKDIKQLGASNPLLERPKTIMSRTILARAGTYYQEHFSDKDGRIRTQLDMIWVSGWAPDISQQKPLKPGSAHISLKDVLPSKNQGLPE